MDLAAALEAAPRSMIEFMHGDFDLGDPVPWHGWDLAPPLIQMLLAIADAFFHATIVAWKMGWIV